MTILFLATVLLSLYPSTAAPMDVDIMSFEKHLHTMDIPQDIDNLLHMIDMIKLKMIDEKENIEQFMLEQEQMVKRLAEKVIEQPDKIKQDSTAVKTGALMEVERLKLPQAGRSRQRMANKIVQLPPDATVEQENDVGKVGNNSITNGMHLNTQKLQTPTFVIANIAAVQNSRNIESNASFKNNNARITGRLANVIPKLETSDSLVVETIAQPLTLNSIRKSTQSSLPNNRNIILSPENGIRRTDITIANSPEMKPVIAIANSPERKPVIADRALPALLRNEPVSFDNRPVSFEINKIRKNNVGESRNKIKTDPQNDGILPLKGNLTTENVADDTRTFRNLVTDRRSTIPDNRPNDSINGDTARLKPLNSMVRKFNVDDGTDEKTTPMKNIESVDVRERKIEDAEQRVSKADHKLTNISKGINENLGAKATSSHSERNISVTTGVESGTLGKNSDVDTWCNIPQIAFTAVRTKAIPPAASPVMFDKVLTNIGSSFQNPFFTAPVSGLYTFHVDFEYGQTEAELDMEVVNEGEVIMKRSLGSTGCNCSGKTMQINMNLHLDKGEKMWIETFGQNFGENELNGGYHLFSGRLLIPDE